MGFGSRERPLHASAVSTYEYICSNPGATFSEIMQGVRIGNGTLQYALRRLEDSGKIIDVREKRFHRFYPNDQTKGTDASDSDVSDDHSLRTSGKG